jgi:murein tripeptide amidase MpaA
MKITDTFDSGSIKVINATDIKNITLALKTDNNHSTKQWFYFRCETKAGLSHKIRIVNAGDSSFANAWTHYQALASYNNVDWFRVPTKFTNNELVIEYTPTKTAISYAYFTPYQFERQKEFITQANKFSLCQHTQLGVTDNQNPIDLLTIGLPGNGKKSVWIIARQHPGETMAQWFTEGVVTKLLSSNSIAKELLQKAVFYIVPNMNPDGSIIGNHRTNQQGFNLNRHWHDASKELCPEVYYVQKKMGQTGVDLFLDIHGDEEIPYSFIMSPQNLLDEADQVERFKLSFMAETDDFQVKYDYNTYCSESKGCCGSGCGSQQSKATEYVYKTFNCLAMVLEMPFSDHYNQINNQTGWSARRSSQLGESILKPIFQIL